MNDEIIEEVEVGMANCKYCRMYDQKSNMHKDKWTKEFYHEQCRPRPKGNNEVDLEDGESGIESG